MAKGSQVNLKLTPGEILIPAGALVTLVFSFFDFYSGNGLLSGRSAWSKGFVPVVTLIVLFTLIMGAQVALTKLANVDLGTGVAGFTWPQVHVALGFFAVVLSLAWLVNSKGPYGIGVGMIFMLLGSIACFVGAFLLSSERAKT
jgi:hypothetical protein